MAGLGALFVTAFLVGLSGAMVPGPLVLVNVYHTTRRGLAAAPLVSLGHGLAELAFAAALWVGLGRLLSAPAVTTFVAVAGGAVLAWMGLGMMREARTAAWDHLSRPARAGWGPVGAGLAASVSNPYWFAWWATVGASYVAMARPWGPVGGAVFLAGHLLSDLAWLTLVSFTLVTGRRVLSDRSYRFILAALGAFLCVLAAAFLLWAGRLLGL